MSEIDDKNETNNASEVCTPTDKPIFNAKPIISEFTRTRRLYLESHEGAWLAHCSKCKCKGIYYWVEIYDDIWAYWVPATEAEALALTSGDSNDPFFPGDNFRAFFKGRVHAEQNPGNIRCWGSGDVWEGPPF